jgi:hypothetical protein
MKRAAKPLTVLPSKGLPNVALGVEFFLPLFLRWRDVHDPSQIESCRPVPEIEQGQVRRIHRRTTT